MVLCWVEDALSVCVCFFFFNDTATTEIYTLSLHDALPIFEWHDGADQLVELQLPGQVPLEDRKSTRLNSSHANISYAVFCLKKKKQLYCCLEKKKKKKKRISTKTTKLKQ